MTSITTFNAQSFLTSDADLVFCCQVLGLPCDGSVKIEDRYKDLVLLHYTEEADKRVFGKIRGTIVNLKTGRVIEGGVYSHTAVSENVPVDNEGNIVIADEEGGVLKTNLGEANFYRGREGTYIRVFMEDGEMLISTHKKISAVKSKYGSYKTIVDLYYELGELRGRHTQEELFADYKFSKYVYQFIICHPSLFAVSQEETSGYLAFVGAKEIRQVDLVPEELTCEELVDFDEEESLMIDEANELLEEGNFVLMEAEGIMTRIESPDYHYRSMIRGVNSYGTGLGKAAFNTKFRLFVLMNLWGDKAKRMLLKHSSIVEALRWAVPVHLKGVVNEAYDAYSTDTVALATWIAGNQNPPAYAADIIRLAKGRDPRELLRIIREYDGGRIYTLVKNMKGITVE